jgi:hypothetical protein
LRQLPSTDSATVGVRRLLEPARALAALEKEQVEQGAGEATEVGDVRDPEPPESVNPRTSIAA